MPPGGKPPSAALEAGREGEAREVSALVQRWKPKLTLNPSLKDPFSTLTPVQGEGIALGWQLGFRAEQRLSAPPTS